MNVKFAELGKFIPTYSANRKGSLRTARGLLTSKRHLYKRQGGDVVEGKIDQHLGARITEARRSSELGQADMANAIEMSINEYAALERGEVRIRAVYLARLARLVGRPISWFYKGLPGQAVFEKTTDAKSV